MAKAKRAPTKKKAAAKRRTYPTGRRTGRPMILETEPERVDALLAYVREGLPDAHACALAGVSITAYKRWVAQAESGRGQDGQPLAPEAHEILRSFKADRDKARAERLRVLIKKIDQEPGGARWLASRSFPEDFGDKVEATVKVDLSLAKAELDGLVAKLAEAERPGEEEGTK